jgi:hypothetical protein
VSAVRACVARTEHLPFVCRYLGPTSAAAELALAMANMGKVSAVLACARVRPEATDRSRRAVSCLTPLSAPAACCSPRPTSVPSLSVRAPLPPCKQNPHLSHPLTGCDLDYRIIHGHQHGKAIGATVVSNFQQYGLPRPELILGDASVPMFRADKHKLDGPVNDAALEGYVFDAIICDPPYGVRAGARRTGKAPEVAEKHAERAALRVRAAEPQARVCPYPSRLSFAPLRTHVDRPPWMLKRRSTM